MMVSVKQTFVKSYFCANLDLHFSTQMTISTNFKDYYSFSYFQIIMSSFSVQLYSKGAAARTTKWLCWEKIYALWTKSILACYWLEFSSQHWSANSRPEQTQFEVHRFLFSSSAWLWQQRKPGQAGARSSITFSLPAVHDVEDMVF